jgi:hypothetical protein
MEALTMMKEEMRLHLTEKILPFWEKLTDWDRGGW